MRPAAADDSPTQLAHGLAAQAAAQKFYDTVRFMHSNPAPPAGADMIELIKNTAQSKNDPNVYVLAQIPAPQAPGVTPPPGTPFDFAVGLLQDGSLELRWKCSNPAGTFGTIYEVQRKVGAGGSLSFAGATGVKTFTDSTLPEGSSPVTYQITAIRSTSRGNPAQFTVNFGVGGGAAGITVETAADNTPMKLAA